MVEMLNFGGFWRRFVASIIDGVWLLIIMVVPLHLIYGEGYVAFTGNNPYTLPMFFFEQVLPLIVTVLFWLKWGATPGKRLLGLKIIKADIYGQPSLGQLIVRYVAYFLSTIVFFLGFVWIGFDKRKQGWHDKIAKTIVVRE